MATNLIRVGPTPPPAWGSSSRVEELDRHEGLPFSDEEFEARLATIRSEMERRELDALLVFRPSSVEYVCGFHNVAEPIPIPVLVLHDRTVLCLLEFEAGRAVVSSRVDEILYHSRAEDGLELFIDYLVSAAGPSARVGLEMEHPWVPPKVVLALQGKGCVLVDAPVVELARLVLSDREIEYMREAAVTTGLGIEAAVEAAAEPGATDATIAAAIAAALTSGGDSLSGLDVIVAAGWAGGIPHSSWGARPIDRSLPVVLEFAGARHRYCAPVMRTIAYEPLTGEAGRLEEHATRCEELLLGELRAGRPCSEVARAVTEGLGEVEPWVVFHWVYGYPIGVSHPPTWMDGYPFYLSEQNEGVLEAGMTFHCPASFRSFGRLGVCFSNTLVIREDGPEVLTPRPASVLYV